MFCRSSRCGSARGRALAGFLAVGLILVSGPARAGDRYELDGGREAALIGAGLVTGAGALLLGANQTPLTVEEIAGRDRSQIGGFDRISTRKWSESADKASDILAMSLMVSPALLYTQTGAGMDAGELTVMWGETLLLQQATTGLLKSLFGRARPFVYNDDPRIPTELKQSSTAVRSFPSGHTATAFAGAVFLGEVFARLNPEDSSRHWVRGTSLALAAVTGWLRIEAGRHYPTDVLAGAVLGSLIGWGVPQLHEVSGGGGGDKARPGPGMVFGFSF